MKKRILKVNQLIQRELSQIILREIDFPRGVLVTVTRAKTSPDLSSVEVSISCLPENRSSEVSKILQKQIYKIQGILNKRLVIKKTPRIRFVKELKTKEARRIEDLLDLIKKKGLKKD